MKDCPHCDTISFALKHRLKETRYFWVVCDVHPLTEGHILIVPKSHISCIGVYDATTFTEFKELFVEFSKFISKTYGSIATFEHGNTGQTVFHSHVHLLPFTGKPDNIVPEGSKYLKSLNDISRLHDVFKLDGAYLMFSIGSDMWTVDNKIGAPRFFRDRFAIALGSPERGNWKLMHKDKNLMDEAQLEIKNLEAKWKTFSKQ